VELQNFQQRKRLLEYDDVMNQQREVVYGLRLFALEGGEELKAEAVKMIEAALARFAQENAVENPETWDRKAIESDLLHKYLVSAPDLADAKKVPDLEAATRLLKDAGKAAFQARLAAWEEMGKRYGVQGISEKLLSHVMQGVLDEKWKDHLYDLDQLRNAIQYRAWGQKDPLIEYKQEAFDMFVDLMHDIRATFTERLFKFQVEITAGPPGAPPRAREPGEGGPRRPLPRPQRAPQPSSDTDLLVSGGGPSPAPTGNGERDVPGPGRVNLPAQREMGSPVPRVGRNDPCPCGSGKKYKKCHGANA
jgi:preprotein translocase subunit SecA